MSVAAPPRRGQTAGAISPAVPAGRAGSPVASRWTPLLLGLILLVRLALGAAYSLLQPPLESHDETGHAAYVAWIAQHLALPPPGNATTAYFDEGHQPPLYYLVPGLLGHLLGLGGQYTPPMNPFFLSGDGSRGVNAAVHVPAAERPPWQGGLLLLHLARFWSVLLGVVAVLLTWLAGRLALPGRPGVALSGTAIAAFVPTSLGVTDAVTNDALVPVTFGLALVAALALVRAPGTARAAGLGLALGLGLLTKNSALALLPFALLVLAVAWRRRAVDGAFAGRGWAEAVRWGAALYGVAALVAGWWYLRNRLLYGHWLTDRKEASPLINALGVQGSSVLHSASGSFAGQLLSYSFRSFWALLGWGTLAAPEWAYRALLVFTLLCLAGLAWAAGRSMRRRRYDRQQRTAGGAPIPERLGVLLLALFFLAMLPEPLYRAVYYEAPTLVPGRYLFGARGAAGLLLALGWSEATARLRPLLALPGLGLAVLSAWLVVAVVQPAYAAPAALPPGARIPNPLDVVFGSRMHLVGYQLKPGSVSPGGRLHVTLYWQALRPMTVAYTVGVHIVDADGHTSLGQVDSFPGRGNLGTPLWQPGRTYADPYDIPLDTNAPAPRLGRLYVGVQLQELDPHAPADNPMQRVTEETLASTDSNGRPTTALFGQFRIGGPVRPDGAPLADRFGEALGLEAQSLTVAPGQVEVHLRLRALRAPLPRLVVFAHLLRPDGVATGQGRDAEPLDGAYPTDLWPAGEAVDDTLRIALPAGFPPGRYLVETGVYRQGGARLDVLGADGQSQPGQRLIVGTVDLSP